MGNTDEHDDDFDEADASNLVKDLRKQLREAKKRDTERDALLNEFLAQKRKSTVADALKAKGADERFAKFYTGEDSSEEAVNTWIAENAELLGVGSDDQGADEETVEAAARISQSLSTAPAVKPAAREALAAELHDPKITRERYLEIVGTLAASH